MAEVSTTLASPLPGPATRADAEVRAVLSALQGLSQPSEGVLERPVPVPGDRYTRQQLHAQGGLGRVWRGRDELLGREVAIKEPRDDRPGDAARAALEREAWFLGRLQHPNIVPLYDLAARPDGRAAFYVMPFLAGDGLHERAARFHASRPPGPATRLTLLPLLTAFLDVCAALDHAHERGVWHLDIKGANVKIGPAGAAVVLDWGLARSATPIAGEPPAPEGAAGGTPAFMAPEQAEPTPERIGPYTDVYGLGALLYLLLTGQPPHPDAGRGDRAALLAELRRPVMPPRAHWPAVPAALEAVCLKALATEPGDRYASVAALRDEVRHWLADEPVTAYREPLPARVTRWGRRHTWAASAVAAVLTTTLLALAVGLFVVDRERQETEQQRQAAEAALDRERESFRQALKAGEDYFTAVSDSPRLQEPGQQPLRRELLERGLAYYQDFLKRRGDEPALKAEVAAAWFRIGQAQAEIGTLADARVAYQEALTRGEELLAAHPDDDTRAQLARWYIADAIARWRSGSFADSLRRQERAMALAEELPADHPQRTYLMALVLAIRGTLFDVARNPTEACAAAERAEALFAQVPPSPATQNARGTNLLLLGSIQSNLKRLPEAAASLRQARRIYEEMQTEPARALTAQWRLATCDHILGMVARGSGDPRQARAYFEAARTARRRLAEQSPSVLTYRAELVSSCLNLARLHRDVGDRALAREASREAYDQADRMVALDPAAFYYRAMAVRACQSAAGDAEAQGDSTTAARLRARSAELLEGFDARTDKVAWQTLARDALTDGLRQLGWGQLQTAGESFRQAFLCQRRAERSAHSGTR